MSAQKLLSTEGVGTVSWDSNNYSGDLTNNPEFAYAPSYVEEETDSSFFIEEKDTKEEITENNLVEFAEKTPLVEVSGGGLAQFIQKTKPKQRTLTKRSSLDSSVEGGDDQHTFDIYTTPTEYKGQNSIDTIDEVIEGLPTQKQYVITSEVPVNITNNIPQQEKPEVKVQITNQLAPITVTVPKQEPQQINVDLKQQPVENKIVIERQQPVGFSWNSPLDVGLFSLIMAGILFLLVSTRYIYNANKTHHREEIRYSYATRLSQGAQYTLHLGKKHTLNGIKKISKIFKK